jgi:segregation and condensation protein B
VTRTPRVKKASPRPRRVPTEPVASHRHVRDAVAPHDPSVTDDPTTGQLAAEGAPAGEADNAEDEASADPPRTGEAAAGEPTAEDAAAGGPTAEDAAAGEPTAEDAAAGEPTAEDAAAGGPTAEDAAAYEAEELAADEGALPEDLPQEEVQPDLPLEIEPARLLPRVHLRGLLEALVFASDKPMTAHELAKLASAPLKEVKEILGELRETYAQRGITLGEVAGGWLFRTNAQFAPFVRELTGEKPVRLSRAQLETLAITAYRQPITRPEIDEIRGVDSGATMKLLLERELLRILGKKDEPGRPLLYGTTPAFLEFFGLKSLKELPTLREFAELSDESRAVAEAELGEVIPRAQTPVAEPATEAEPTEATEHVEGTESLEDTEPNDKAHDAAVLADVPSEEDRRADDGEAGSSTSADSAPLADVDESSSADDAALADVNESPGTDDAALADVNESPGTDETAITDPERVLGGDE